MIQISGGRWTVDSTHQSLCYICDVHAALHRQTDGNMCAQFFLFAGPKIIRHSEDSAGEIYLGAQG
jgi:hypothetical protein